MWNKRTNRKANIYLCAGDRRTPAPGINNEASDISATRGPAILNTLKKRGELIVVHDFNNRSWFV